MRYLSKQKILQYFLLLFCIVGISFAFSKNTNAATQYKIQFDANGGSGSVPSTITVEGDSKSVVMGDIDSVKPTKTGYTFIGWSASTVYNSKRISYSSIQAPDGTSSIVTSSSWSYETYCTNSGGNSSNNTLTLYAVWSSGITYTISYNANGGSGAPSSQTKIENVELPMSSTAPTRTGYLFYGWGTSSTSTTVSYYPGDYYSNNSSITLYAIWRKKVTITFDPNGGDTIRTLTGYMYYNASSFTFNAPSSYPSRSGYSFRGWAASASSSAVDFKPGDSVSITPASIAEAEISLRVYALWTTYTTSTYKIQFDANGGSGNLPTTIAREGESSSVVMGDIQSAKPTRENYVFCGWSASSSYNTKRISYTSNTAPDGTSSAITGSGWSYDTYCNKTGGSSTNKTLTLYAMWLPYNNFSISYNANGGSGAPSSSSVSNSTSSSYGFTVSSTRPTRSDWTFVGWSTNKNATSAEYNPGDSITATYENKNIILYAIWKRTITLSYNLNGGSGSVSSQSATIYNATSSYPFTIRSTVPTKTGYSFLGWSTSSSATSASYQPSASISLNNSTTLYAVWGSVPSGYTYTIQFNVNGGSGSVPATITQTGDSTSTVMGDIQSVQPSRSGYAFCGWSASSSYNAKRVSWSSITAPDGTSSATTSSSWTYADYCSKTGGSSSNSTLTLYAMWLPYNNFSISYNVNGGSGGPSSGASASSPQSTYTFTIDTAVPSRSGWTFVGWSTSSSATTASYQAGDSISVSYASPRVTLYAIWKKTITLSYNLNGGSGSVSSQSATIYNATSSYTFTIRSTVPTKTGYSFLGWSKSSSATSASYQPSTSITLSSNTTLYAVWNLGYSIQFNANGGSGSVPSTITKTGDSTSIVMGDIQSAKPTRSGYAFCGWSASSSYNAKRISYTSITAPDGTSSVVTSSSWTYADYCSKTGGSSSNKTLVLYAMWCPNNSFSVKYDANGGSGAPSASSATTEKSYYDFTVSSTKPTRSGWTFVGWSTNKNATSAQYTSGGTIRVSYGTSTVTLYAIWAQANSTYKIQFNLNGGSGSVPSTITKEGTSSSVIMGDIQSVVPSRSGYTFCGWSASSSYNSKRISYRSITAPDGTNSVVTGFSWTYADYCNKTGGSSTNKTLTLYAMWKSNVQVITASNITKTYSTKNISVAIKAKALGGAKLTYKSNNKKVKVSASGKVTIPAKFMGEASIVIKAAAAGGYNAASKTIKVTVNPTPTKVVHLKYVKENNKLVPQLQWKQNKLATGYQVSCSSFSDFSTTKTKNYSKKFSRVGINSLSKGQYYFRIRTIRKVGKKNFYSTWSKTYKITIK